MFLSHFSPGFNFDCPPASLTLGLFFILFCSAFVFVFVSFSVQADFLSFNSRQGLTLSQTVKKNSIKL